MTEDASLAIRQRLVTQCDAAPLLGQDDRYVAPPANTLAAIERELRLGGSGSRVAVFGQTGSGVRTALLQMVRQLGSDVSAPEYLIVRCDSEPELTLGGPGWVGRRLVRCVAAAWLHQLSSWYTSVGANFPLLVGGSLIPSEDAWTLLQQVAVTGTQPTPRSRELELLHQLRVHCPTWSQSVVDVRPLIIDEIRDGPPADVLGEVAGALEWLPGSVILVAPPTLRSTAARLRARGFREVVSFPTWSVADRDGREFPAGRSALAEVVARRLRAADLEPKDVFAHPGVQDRLLAASGGNLAQLLGLFRTLLVQADAFPLTQTDVDTVLALRRREHRAELSGGQLVTILGAFPTGALDPAAQPWLARGQVLEYADEEGLWWDANPLLRDPEARVPLRPALPTALERVVLERPWRLRKLECRQFGCFGDFTLEFPFARPEPESEPEAGERGQWLYFLGRNGSGKSNLLRALCLVLASEAAAQGLLSTHAARLPAVALTASRATVRCEAGGDPFRLEVARLPAGGEQAQADPVRERPFLAAYGARRGSALGGAAREVDLESPLAGLATLFDEGAGLVHAETWLKERQVAADHPAEGDGTREQAFLDALYATLRELLPGVETVRVKGDRVWVTGPAVGHVPLSTLSDGYLTTLGWVVDMVARWSALAQRQELPVDAGFNRQMGGVVLVDEVDLHLHPLWQRELVRKLRELFPRMTFVVTSHNPLTLLGARAGEIHILERADDGTFFVTQRDLPPGIDTEAVLTGDWFGLISTLSHDVLALLDRHQGYRI